MARPPHHFGSHAGAHAVPPPLPPPPAAHGTHPHPSQQLQPHRYHKSRLGCASRTGSHSTSSGATYEGGELCVGDHGSFAPEPPQPLPGRSMYNRPVYQHTTVSIMASYPLPVPFYEESAVPTVTVTATAPTTGSGSKVRPVASLIPGRAGSNASLSGTSSCSARCEAFSNFCYYFFQVVLSVGLLGGISLLIAVCVLRGQSWNRDLSSLPYIGFLLVIVCSGLLGVQINAQRSKHRRKCARVATRTAATVGTLGRTGAVGSPSDLIPLQRINAGPAPSGVPNAPPLELMYQPLLPPGRTTLTRHVVDRQDRPSDMINAIRGPPRWRRSSQNERTVVR